MALTSFKEVSQPINNLYKMGGRFIYEPYAYKYGAVSFMSFIASDGKVFQHIRSHSTSFPLSTTIPWHQLDGREQWSSGMVIGVHSRLV